MQSSQLQIATFRQRLQVSFINFGLSILIIPIFFNIYYYFRDGQTIGHKLIGLKTIGDFEKKPFLLGNFATHFLKKIFFFALATIVYLVVIFIFYIFLKFCNNEVGCGTLIHFFSDFIHILYPIGVLYLIRGPINLGLKTIVQKQVGFKKSIIYTLISLILTPLVGYGLYYLSNTERSSLQEKVSLRSGFGISNTAKILYSNKNNSFTYELLEGKFEMGELETKQNYNKCVADGGKIFDSSIFIKRRECAKSISGYAVEKSPIAIANGCERFIELGRYEEYGTYYASLNDFGRFVKSLNQLAGTGESICVKRENYNHVSVVNPTSRIFYYFYENPTYDYVSWGKTFLPEDY